MRAWLVVVSLSLIVAAIGCRDDSTGPGIVEPPSFVRSTVPADSAEGISGTTDISVTFRRTVLESGVVLDLFPAPISQGTQVLSPTGRNITWLDVELDPDVLAYRLLVDGASVPTPEQILLFPTTLPGVAGRMGGCLSLSEEGPDLSETVVFAVPPADEDLSVHALPDFFRRQHASSIALVGPGPEECASFYFFTYMKVEPVAVIAVIDSSGDGEYDLDDDWWGYLGSESAASSILPSDSPFGVPLNLHITLHPPQP